MIKRGPTGALAALAALLAVPPLSAQTRAAIVGTVSDAAGAPLSGARLSLESPDLVGGAQTAASNARGEYRFQDLPPGLYTLTASLQGFRTVKRPGLRVPFGVTLTVDLGLPVGGEETITVEGRSPAVDVTTAQSVSRIDSDLLLDLPLAANKRSPNEVTELAPGVKDHAAYGGARDANEMMLDGTATTVPQRQGTNAVVFATNWLEEVQVVSLGAAAEYGEFTGTAANFVVRSGSNEFHGLAEYTLARDAWVGDNTGALPASLKARFTPLEILSQWDTTLQVGGPIKKDRLFFFAGFQYLKVDAIQAGAPASMDQTWPRYLGKLSWAVSDVVKAEATATYSKSRSTGGGVPGSTAETGGDNIQPNGVVSLRATWAPSPRTFFEFRAGGLDYEQDITPAAPRSKQGPPPRRDAVTGISSGNSAQFRLQQGRRASVGASLTRHFEGAGPRRHRVKVGFEYEHVKFLEQGGFPGGMSFVDRAGVPDQVTLWAGDLVQARGSRTTLYAQDDWRVTPSLTVQPGVRVSFNRGRTPTAGRVFETSPLGPRLGLAWDVAGNHKTVVRAHYGRFHEAFGTSLFEFTDTDTQTPRITARVAGPGDFREINRFTPAGNLAVDPDIAHAYMDQLLLGVERELWSGLSVKVQYINRRWRDLFAFVDTRSTYEALQRPDPGPDGRTGTSDDGGPVTLFNLTNPGQSFLVLTNPDGAWRRYDALQLIVQKRMSGGWQVLGSYTLSEARGTANNQVGDNVALSGTSTGRTGVFADPNQAIRSEGRNVLDFRHQFTLRSSYHAPVLGGFDLSASYRYVTGGAWSRTVNFTGLRQGAAVVRVEPRGAQPSAATNQLDLRAGKSFPLGAQRRLAVFVDCFNALNKGFAEQARYTEASGGTFGLPQSWTSPRIFQVAARLQF